MMRFAFLLLGVFAVLSIAPVVHGQTCQIKSVDPESGKVGDTVGATGQNMSKANLEELFLTDGTNDIKVVIVEQSDTAVKFTIPKNAKPGRYSLMIKSKNMLLEQPVKLTVEGV